MRPACRGVRAELEVVTAEALGEVGPFEPFQVHGQEGDVVERVEVAQRVVELQAVEHPRPVVQAEDVVRDQIAVTVDDATTGDSIDEQRPPPGQVTAGSLDRLVEQVLVQNRVSAAMAQLPTPVQQQGVVTKKKETSPLQIITLSSKDNRYDALLLSNFATLQLQDKLARLPGVGDVVVFGIGEYSMRVWLNPEQLNQRGLVPQDVINAIQQQNAEVAAGQIGMPPTPTAHSWNPAFEANVLPNWLYTVTCPPPANSRSGRYRSMSPDPLPWFSR